MKCTAYRGRIQGKTCKKKHHLRRVKMARASLKDMDVNVWSSVRLFVQLGFVTEH